MLIIAHPLEQTNQMGIKTTKARIFLDIQHLLIIIIIISTKGEEVATLHMHEAANNSTGVLTKLKSACHDENMQLL